MIILWYLIEKSSLNLVLKKGVFLTNSIFTQSVKGLLHFHQETSSLIGNQTNHRANTFLPYESNSCYKSDYERICVVINGKTRSVPLNILSSDLNSLPILKRKNLYPQTDF